MKILYQILIWQLLFPFFVSSSSLADDKSYAVWSAQEDSHINIFYAVLSNAHWSEPVRITTSGFNVTPAITVDSDGVIWIVWVNFEKENRILKYAIIRNGDIEQGQVHGSLWERSYSPSIIVDHFNKAWVVWAGFTGTDEDIFSSRWNGSSWDVPIQVNSDNNFPDSKPTIGLDADGKPWVSWLAFNGDKDDIGVAYWSGRHWSFDLNPSVKSNMQKAMNRVKGQVPQFPVQAKNRLMGAVYNNDEVQSVSDRLAH